LRYLPVVHSIEPTQESADLLRQLEVVQVDFRPWTLFDIELHIDHYDRRWDEHRLSIPDGHFPYLTMVYRLTESNKRLPRRREV